MKVAFIVSLLLRFLHDTQIVVGEGADGERDAADQLHDGHLQHERLPLQEGADDVDQKPERETLTLYP